MWWRVTKAARYLGVPPWELAEQPSLWVTRALAAEELDAVAEAAAKRRAAKKG